jgi:hypothetical protein
VSAALYPVRRTSKFSGSLSVAADIGVHAAGDRLETLAVIDGEIAESGLDCRRAAAALFIKTGAHVVTVLPSTIRTIRQGGCL